MTKLFGYAYPWNDFTIHRWSEEQVLLTQGFTGLSGGVYMTSRKRQYMFPMYPWNPHKEDVGQRPLYMLSTSKKKIFHQMGLDIYIYIHNSTVWQKKGSWELILRPCPNLSFLELGIAGRYTYIYIYLSMHAMQCRRVCQFLPVTVGFLGSSLCHMDGLCNGRSQCCLIMCLAVNPHKIRPVEIEWCL